MRDTEIFTKMTGTSEDQLALTIVDDTVWITAHHHLEGGSTYALAGHAN
ncbi:hypothetical protein [Mycolicibacterium sp. CBMA 226]|nr:hypothetical protein [Mycolicibacterium sp. CBMA 226]